MIKTLVFLASAAVLVVAHHEEEIVERAIAILDGNGVKGSVVFATQPDGNVRITGQITGMLAGKYGFHIHEKGDITPGCKGALGHFNPNHKDHGHPDDENRHVGDLGNIEFDANKVANIDIVDSQVKLMGRQGIIGRALVLHEGTDDHGRSNHPDSKKTGNAGGRVVCGVVGILDSHPASKAAPAAAATSLLILSLFAFVL